MKPILVAVILFISISALGSEQDIVPSRTGLEVVDYHTVPILIEIPTQQAQNIGLTQEMIGAHVNLELRKHGLKGIDAEENKARDRYLYVTVHVNGAGFAIDLAFSRRITFVSGDTTYSAYAKTWTRVAAGGSARGSDSILDTLGAGLELFVSDYLKANDK